MTHRLLEVGALCSLPTFRLSITVLASIKVLARRWRAAEADRGRRTASWAAVPLSTVRERLFDCLRGAASWAAALGAGSPCQSSSSLTRRRRLVAGLALCLASDAMARSHSSRRSAIIFVASTSLRVVSLATARISLSKRCFWYRLSTSRPDRSARSPRVDSQSRAASRNCPRRPPQRG